MENVQRDMCDVLDCRITPKAYQLWTSVCMFNLKTFHNKHNAIHPKRLTVTVSVHIHSHTHTHTLQANRCRKDTETQIQAICQFIFGIH